MENTTRILLIEDDRDDVDLFELSLKNNSIIYDLQVIRDGALAVKYFQSDNTKPDIIVLDFNQPKVHGREVLREYSSSAYASVPLVVLTTSSAVEDKSYALKNSASSFMIKPNTRQGLDEMILSIMDVVISK
jgi:DNA-binding response OmpR family regulator